MATGQIEDSVADAVAGARAKFPSGESSPYCVECGEEIPEVAAAPPCRG